MTGTTTLTDATPGSYTITANNWKIVNFNDKAYFFQRGYDPLVYDNATGLRTFTVANGGATAATLKCHEVSALTDACGLWTTQQTHRQFTGQTF